MLPTFHFLFLHVTAKNCRETAADGFNLICYLFESIKCLICFAKRKKNLCKKIKTLFIQIENQQNDIIRNTFWFI